ncbi:MAG: galactokinase [Deltaproteobacteria bacterium]|nr:galactokinase [Deltaproteobacteria bacterium]
MSLSIKDILEESPIAASAPCRIDSGGTWDIRAMALPCEHIRPATVNMALNLRSRVTISPFQDHKIRISSQGFSRSQVFHKDDLPFDSPFGIFLAAISFFNVHGIDVRISSASPVKSAMGGSSTALVALLKALDKIHVRQGGTGLDTRRLLHLAYSLEDGISGGNCGIQDQAAAVYGGVNLWTWQYSNSRNPFKREPLLETKKQRILSSHLAVAYSGKSHVSSRTNKKWIGDFLSGKTRKGWIKVNTIVRMFAEELQAMRWAGAARLLRQEMALRREITPEALIPITEDLIGQAEKAGCGARFTGAGAGGTVWAIGGMENIEKVKIAWEEILAPIKGASVLNCGIDNTGVR